LPMLGGRKRLGAGKSRPCSPAQLSAAQRQLSCSYLNFFVKKRFLMLLQLINLKRS
jgi:hypothetical protein